ncbi:MAG: helix-turn-helix domain-containing protein [Acidimicrobiales bacterium]
MLVELGLVEQRYQTVLEVLDHGATVTDVARRNGVSRQAVHEWLRRYAAHGLAGLVDREVHALVRGGVHESLQLEFKELASLNAEWKDGGPSGKYRDPREFLRLLRDGTRAAQGQ